MSAISQVLSGEARRELFWIELEVLNKHRRTQSSALLYKLIHTDRVEYLGYSTQQLKPDTVYPDRLLT